jgi:SAM-dependent methyltransferase
VADVSGVSGAAGVSGGAESLPRIAAAYDGIAAGYDGLVAEDAWMREILWAHHRRVFRPGDRVLDVACGTGLDTLHLAAHGLRMTGLDASPGMLAALEAKSAACGLAGRVETRAGDAASLEHWPAAAFDGAISSFAGLNTVDLPRFAAAAARVIRPGGRVILHLLAPAGVWERLRLAAGGRLAEACLLTRRRELTVAIAGQPVRHTLHPAADLYRRCFAAAFFLRRRYGLGWLWPRCLSPRLPAALRRLLGRVDAALGRLDPWRGWGRFYVLDMERRERLEALERPIAHGPSLQQADSHAGTADRRLPHCAPGSTRSTSLP